VALAARALVFVPLMHVIYRLLRAELICAGVDVIAQWDTDARRTAVKLNGAEKPVLNEDIGTIGSCNKGIMKQRKAGRAPSRSWH